MTLREELGSEDYARFARAVTDYCVAPSTDDNAILCPRRAVRERWRRAHLSPRFGPFRKDPAP